MVFNSILEIHEKEMTLCAIWLNKAIQTSKRITCRISEGDLVRVDEGILKDVSADYPANYKIIECRGNISNTVLYAILENLETKEFLIINFNK